MTLISVILCIALERFLDSLHTIRNYRWLESLALSLSSSADKRKTYKNYLLLFSIILLAPLIVLVIDVQLKYLFQPLEFIFSVAVLFFAIGPETFYGRLKSFCEAKQRDDETSALWFAEKILRRPLTDNEKLQSSATLAQNFFPISNDRIFAPVFWFALLGPFGAMLYRCCSRVYFIYGKHQSPATTLQAPVLMMLGLINWIPARLCAMGFTLVGNFSRSLHYCDKPNMPAFFSLKNHDSESLLTCMACGAIDLPSNPTQVNPSHLQDALAILRRNIELWLGLLALLTLTGSL